MTNPHPRRLPVHTSLAVHTPLAVLVLLAVLALPAVGFGFCPDLWDTAESCACAVADEIGPLVDCDVKKVARKAIRACQALTGVRQRAADEECAAYFKDLQKATKRVRGALRIAERKGFDVETPRAAMTGLRVATRKMIEDGVDTLKERPDYLTNDKVVRAAARAEMCLEMARRSLDGKRPFTTSMGEYRKAFLVMCPFL